MSRGVFFTELKLKCVELFRGYRATVTGIALLLAVSVVAASIHCTAAAAPVNRVGSGVGSRALFREDGGDDDQQVGLRCVRCERGEVVVASASAGVKWTGLPGARCLDQATMRTQCRESIQWYHKRNCTY